MVDQRRNVFAALGQRGDRNRNDVEPVEQVLTEPALGNLALEVTRGGGYHPHIDADLTVPADADEGLFGQHAEDAGLGGKRHVRHFV